MWAFTRDEREYQAQLKAPFTFNRYRYKDIVWKAGLFTTVWNRIFDLAFVQHAALFFDETLGWADHLGEDTDFNARYIAAYYPNDEFPVLVSSQPRYFYFAGNPHAVTENVQQSGKHRTIGEPVPGYCNQVLIEYREAEQNAPAALRQDHEFVRHYLRALAFGVWSAKQLGEALPQGFWKSPELAALLQYCKQNRAYSPYYIPFKLHLVQLVDKLYPWEEAYHINFFRVEKIMYLLFCRGWNR